jgi:type IV pilus assembly protein PilE
MQQNKQYGFSLIELMIALAIIGILAGIAYPNYQDSMIKSRRADAKAALLELSVFMERLYTTTGCYNPGATDKVCGDGNDAAPTLPFLTTPKSGKANYNLTVVATPSTFTLTATPRKADGTSYSDTATDNPDPKCASLSLNNTNTKAESGTATVVSDCW